MSTSIDDDFRAQPDEQAVVAGMLATLSRRQVLLVNRVLGLLEQLEDEETSPARLDSLFQLDHLATLLRRSATSLGILLDSADPGASHEPLPLDDVLQAATAGVEDYRRVSLPEAPDDVLVGRAATDIVHLLTELIDYSLASSLEQTVVDVHSTQSGGPRVLSVANHGLDMSDEHLAAINSMLGPGGVAPADCPRATGLYVVSRLAHRHGVMVLLERSNQGGVIATIHVPCALLSAGEPGRSDPPPDPLTQPWEESPAQEEDEASIFAQLRLTWGS